MTNQKTLLPFLLLLLLAGCATAPYDRRVGSAQPTSIPTAVAPNRPTFTVQQGEVMYRVEFPGRIAPVVDQPLTFATPGTVKEVYVARGDTVQAGDLLAELDTQALAAELLQAQTELAIAQTRLDTTQTELEINRRRAEIAVEIAQLDLDFARQQAGESPAPEETYQISRLELQLENAQLDLQELTETVDPVLQADVDAAQLQVTNLESQIAQARLLAPFDGRILSLNLTPGRVVTSQDVVGVVADPTQLEVSADVSANRLGELAENLPVVMIPASRPGESYTGFIRQMPFRTAGGSEGVVRIAFDNPAQTADFQMGDRLNIQVLVDQRLNVLWLPPEAIRDFSGRKFVVIQDGDLQRRVDVELGLIGSDRVELVSGVREGQVVVGQ